MSQFVSDVVNDLRGGRQTWRVFALVCLPAFAAGLIAGLAGMG
ncbi:MAG TPA: hypothetical protein VFO89_15130 [Thermoanaerobaculia bacterium]|nr:hypothetical protein [Thermoanaerobaculia bacterium]